MLFRSTTFAGPSPLTLRHSPGLLSRCMRGCPGVRARSGRGGENRGGAFDDVHASLPTAPTKNRPIVSPARGAQASSFRLCPHTICSSVVPRASPAPVPAGSAFHPLALQTPSANARTTSPSTNHRPMKNGRVSGSARSANGGTGIEMRISPLAMCSERFPATRTTLLLLLLPS